MNDFYISLVLVPGVLALILLGVFAYLYVQSRRPYFLVWLIAWGCYSGSYLVTVFYLKFSTSFTLSLISKLLMSAVMLAIYISTDVVSGRWRWRPQYSAVAVLFAIWSVLMAAHTAQQVETPVTIPLGSFHLPSDLALGWALLLVLSAYKFWREGVSMQFTSYKLLSITLFCWAVLQASRPLQSVFPHFFSTMGHHMVPLLETVISLSMLMVLYEHERREVQENLVAFSDLELDFGRVLSSEALRPSMERLLERSMHLAVADSAALVVSREFRNLLPACHVNANDKVVSDLQDRWFHELSLLSREDAGQLAAVDFAALISHPEPRVRDMAAGLADAGIAQALLLPICKSDQEVAILLVGYSHMRRIGRSRRSLLISLARQLGTTLEKYILLCDAQRRTQEFELLTYIGQVVSSHLEEHEIFVAIHQELAQLMDTSTFYVAFQDGDKMRFAFEIEEGQMLERRSRDSSYGFTEHIIRTGQPLLIEADLERVREELNVLAVNRPAKCFCGVPIQSKGKTVGAMVTLNYERENVYHFRDLEMMQTASRQVAVALENARLFAQEQRRAKLLSFINNISKTAISSQNAEQMMGEIVSEIQNNFNFDHIGVGILDYNAKEIEIKAEAGSTAKALGKKIPLGVGIMGRVARTGEMALEQGGEEHLLGIMSNSRSVLCIPIRYGDSLLGVLNIESTREVAFAEEEILILRTLADLLATALHNAFVFQKMEQQSITDPLTGLKTRRYFSESLQSEYKRALRSGRPFSVVLIDLDKFKEVNDGMGHLEGDLVLARIGRLFDQKVRQSNVVARYGGDEFVILMPETAVDQAQILSERLRLWIATDPMLNERHVTGSFGLATFPMHGSSVEDIFRVADTAMYVSKKAGGNKVSVMEVSPESISAAEVRQIISSYLEGFLRREHLPTAEEIIGALQKIAQVAGTNAAPATVEAIKSIVRAVEMRELHGAGHGEAVASYVQAMAPDFGFTEGELDDLLLAAYAHDIGKILIPEKVLNKPGALTLEEYALMKSHAVEGARIVSGVPGTERVQSYIRSHQERYDGGGYPDGLKSEHIPLGARIIAVAEAYINMTTERPYADVKTPALALMELERMSGTQFDGAVVRVLVKKLKHTRSANMN